MRAPRFNLKHLLMAVVVIAICLLVVRWRHQETITSIYGDYQAYQLLLESEVFEVYRASSDHDGPWVGVEPSFPSGITINYCGRVPERKTERIRRLLTSPQYFMWDVVKDFSFMPTLLLKGYASRRQGVDVYFDFHSEVAVIVLDGRRVGTLMTDKITPELRESLASICEPPVQK